MHNTLIKYLNKNLTLKCIKMKNEKPNQSMDYLEKSAKKFLPRFKGMDEYFERGKEGFVSFCHSQLSGGIGMQIRNELELWDPYSEGQIYFVNKGIKHADEMSGKILAKIWDLFYEEGDLRRCRVCGCTESDCRQCIEKTGEACSWIEEDLCSACKSNES
jgi:hypothetical protein